VDCTEPLGARFGDNSKMGVVIPETGLAEATAVTTSIIEAVRIKFMFF
jgi:hypothetical protein